MMASGRRVLLLGQRMRRTFTGLVAAAALIAGLAFLPSSAQASNVAVTAVVPGGSLASVSCTSADSCMSVGYVLHSKTEKQAALAEAWDGANWSVSPTVEPRGVQDGSLNAVSCWAVDGCMAVGVRLSTPSSPTLALAETWDGSSWRLVPMPAPAGSTGLSPFGVSCSSAVRCLAVGSYHVTSTLIDSFSETWNGSAWHFHRTINSAGATDSSLAAVSCVTANHCVAAGSTSQLANGGYYYASTLVEVWEGTSWSLQPSPNPTGSGGAFLEGVACRSPETCTAVGWYGTGSGTELPLAEGWNGTTWTTEATPNITGSTGTQLSSVSCTAVTACVAVGAGDKDNNFLPLVEAWNGTSWTLRKAPSSSYPTRELQGVSCLTGTNCGIVGYQADATGASSSLVAFGFGQLAN